MSSIPAQTPLALPLRERLVPFLRKAAKVLGICALGYTVLWLAVVLGMLGASAWAGQHYSSGENVAGINHFEQVDDKVWRGSAPGVEGYRELAERGVHTVVDLRAEDMSAHELAEPVRAGLDVVRMPIRDGQTPTNAQVDQFIETVRESPGPVFVHCGAGVGRTGSMSAAYLVETDQASSRQAALRTLAVGPPSIEQVYYVMTADQDHVDQPPTAVKAVSRLFDAPRRISASIW
ncbi:fused DSP-PTPase phosphatase/NAD kinase-like protein [Streptomyces sp. 6N223]|uniref:fused DSP-PTPase phosphatase/NAD kinase-like protein n=1 Tax=Streptomyces sp. 6N223 TaxID=3457412 RepID=UPI003FD05389